VADNDTMWQMYGNSEVLTKCKADSRFAYVVALARAVNALNAGHSLMVRAGNNDTPSAQRDRMNSYFFSSAIFYEILKLIRSMGAVYGKEKIFQDTIQALLKAKRVQELEQEHLKAARRDAVFHYLPQRFAEAIMTTGMIDCIFVIGQGEKIGDIHYEFADYIAAEMEVGGRIDNHAVVTEMMQNKLELVRQLIVSSQEFIAHQLQAWGFQIRRTPSSRNNQAQG
jgi:hypothetical protein